MTPVRFYSSGFSQVEWFKVGPFSVPGWRWNVWLVDSGGGATYTNHVDGGITWCEAVARQKAKKCMEAQPDAN